MTKRVSFSTVEIREYAQTIADCAVSNAGPPIGLSWSCTHKWIRPLQAYEEERLGKRKLAQDYAKDGVISISERTQMLRKIGHRRSSIEQSAAQSQILKRARETTASSECIQKLFDGQDPDEVEKWEKLKDKLLNEMMIKSKEVQKMAINKPPTGVRTSPPRPNSRNTQNARAPMPLSTAPASSSSSSSSKYSFANKSISSKYRKSSTSKSRDTSVVDQIGNSMKQLREAIKSVGDYGSPRSSSRRSLGTSASSSNTQQQQPSSSSYNSGLSLNNNNNNNMGNNKDKLPPCDGSPGHHNSARAGNRGPVPSLKRASSELMNDLKQPKETFKTGTTATSSFSKLPPANRLRHNSDSLNGQHIPSLVMPPVNSLTSHNRRGSGSSRGPNRSGVFDLGAGPPSPMEVSFDELEESLPLAPAITIRKHRASLTNTDSNSSSLITNTSSKSAPVNNSNNDKHNNNSNANNSNNKTRNSNSGTSSSSTTNNANISKQQQQSQAQLLKKHGSFSGYPLSAKDGSYPSFEELRDRQAAQRSFHGGNAHAFLKKFERKHNRPIKVIASSSGYGQYNLGSNQSSKNIGISNKGVASSSARSKKRLAALEGVSPTLISSSNNIDYPPKPLKRKDKDRKRSPINVNAKRPVPPSSARTSFSPVSPRNQGSLNSVGSGKGKSGYGPILGIQVPKRRSVSKSTGLPTHPPMTIARKKKGTNGPDSPRKRIHSYSHTRNTSLQSMSKAGNTLSGVVLSGNDVLDKATKTANKARRRASLAIMQLEEKQQK